MRDGHHIFEFVHIVLGCSAHCIRICCSGAHLADHIPGGHLSMLPTVTHTGPGRPCLGVGWGTGGGRMGGGHGGGSGGSGDGRRGVHGSGSSGGDGHRRLADATATISNKTKWNHFSPVSTPAQRSNRSPFRHQDLNPGRSGEGRVS